MIRREINPQYIYTAIPAEYVCVYHRILAMLADYGEDMLKDCKAACTDRNSNVIDCFNMFNAAVAAKQLGQDRKAELIINYVKAKINQIYKGVDNSTSFVFPVDENGVLKAFVSCNDRPRFYVTGDELYKNPQDLGFNETYSLEDENDPPYYNPFDFTCEATYSGGHILVDLDYFFNKLPLKEGLNTITTEFYINGKYVEDLSTYVIDTTNMITLSLKVVAYYVGYTNNHDYVIEVV